MLPLLPSKFTDVSYHLGSTETILSLLGQIDDHDPNPHLLEALDNERESIREEVRAAATSSHSVRTAFDGVLDLILQLYQSLVATNNDETKLKTAIKIRQLVATKRKEGSDEDEKQALERMKKLQVTYEEVRCTLS